MATIESLDIQIKADVNNAEKSIDSLVKKLDLLSAKLRGTNSTSKNAFGNIGSSSEKISKAFDKLQKNFKGFSNSANNSRKSANTFTLSLVSLYAKVRLLTGALKTLGKSVQNTADYGEAFNYYTVAFGKIASKWDENWENYADDNARNYANKFVSTLNDTLYKLSGISYNPETGLISETGIKNLGLNLKEATQYAAQLASMMDAVGQSGETTLATTNAFVKLAADMSSLVNVDYAEAASKIRSVLQGQSRAGYSFGWDTTIAALQTTADRLDLSKPVIAMSQMEKQQLRILTVLEQSRVAWGDQSNTINSMSNQMRIFKNNLQEVSMTLGQLFIPALSKIMPIANGALIAIKRLLGGIASLLGIEVKDIGQGFIGAEEDLEGMTEGLDDATKSAKGLGNQLRKFDELNNISTPSNSGIFDNLGEQIDLTKEIVKATEEYEKAWSEAFANMENRANEFADKIEKYLKPIKNIIYDFSIGDFYKAGQDTSNLVSGIFDFFSKSIADVNWDDIGKKIGEFLNGIDWVKVLKSAGNFFLTLINAATDLFVGSFKESPIATTIFGGLLAAKPLTKLLGGVKLVENVANNPILKAGLTIGKTIIAGIAAAFLGFNLGQKINEWITGEKIDLTWTEQFEKIKQSISDGSWKEAIRLWGKDIKEGLSEITTYQNKFGYDLADNFKKWLDEATVYQNELGKEAADWLMNQESIFTQWGEKLGEGFKKFVKGIFGDLEKESSELEMHYTYSADGKVIGGGAKFANGGFPEDGFFFANHNELVGKFSNGKTAVANNAQITQGIADAVYPAVYNAVVSANSNSGGGLTARIEGDPRGMFKVFVDEWNSEARRTQRNPVVIYNK